MTEQIQWEWPHTKKWPKFSGEKIVLLQSVGGSSVL